MSGGKIASDNNSSSELYIAGNNFNWNDGPIGLDTETTHGNVYNSGVFNIQGTPTHQTSFKLTNDGTTNLTVLDGLVATGVGVLNRGNYYFTQTTGGGITINANNTNAYFNNNGGSLYLKNITSGIDYRNFWPTCNNTSGYIEFVQGGITFETPFDNTPTAGYSLYQVNSGSQIKTDNLTKMECPSDYAQSAGSFTVLGSSGFFVSEGDMNIAGGSLQVGDGSGLSKLSVIDDLNINNGSTFSWSVDSTKDNGSQSSLTQAKNVSIGIGIAFNDIKINAKINPGDTDQFLVAGGGAITGSPSSWASNSFNSHDTSSSTIWTISG
jgi:hypothetical protein